MNSGPVRRSLAAACVLPLLLAGCSEADSSPQVPEPSASSSPSADETETGPVEPTLPPKAEGDGVKAAEAFVKHYFAMLSYAQVTGKTSELTALAFTSCAACEGSVRAIRKVYDAGGTISGGEFTVERVRATPQTRASGNGSTYVARATVEHTAQQIQNSGTELDGSGANGIDEFQLLLVRDANAWHIGQWSLL